SVQPVETELGRKTRIDQTSCNTDYSCLDGDCPSFLTVEVSSEKPARRAVPAPPAVADPVLPSAAGGYDVLLAGIGGTGIVTVNQVLATAALLDGLTAVGLDQTGLSQKAGPVTSHLRLGTSSAPATRSTTRAPRTPTRADCSTRSRRPRAR
ncbi:MAG TPA: 2-oxoacid:acceptor oxidoreductase family protein, partial [Mycobacteriales bacterium]|nr:2-oxoacid:acceptor oxidoreductase family protein [Mycobacteriales bacterium]